MNTQEILHAEYGTSKNFVTPHIFKRVSLYRGRIAAEISWGSGFGVESTVYGVSIASVRRDGTTKRRFYRPSRMFDTLPQALDYIDNLRGRLNGTSRNIEAAK